MERGEESTALPKWREKSQALPSSKSPSLTSRFLAHVQVKLVGPGFTTCFRACASDTEQKGGFGEKHLVFWEVMERSWPLILSPRTLSSTWDPGWGRLGSKGVLEPPPAPQYGSGTLFA